VAGRVLVDDKPKVPELPGTPGLPQGPRALRPVRGRASKKTSAGRCAWSSKAYGTFIALPQARRTNAVSPHWHLLPRGNHLKRLVSHRQPVVFLLWIGGQGRGAKPLLAGAPERLPARYSKTSPCAFMFLPRRSGSRDTLHSAAEAARTAFRARMGPAKAQALTRLPVFATCPRSQTRTRWKPRPSGHPGAADLIETNSPAALLKRLLRQSLGKLDRLMTSTACRRRLTPPASQDGLRLIIRDVDPEGWAGSQDFSSPAAAPSAAAKRVKRERAGG